MRKIKIAIKNLLLLTCILISLNPHQIAHATQAGQTDDAQQKARMLLEQLSPEEKIGQLFLVTFEGTDITEDAYIYDLIVNHHIGGVVLLRANDNFTGPDNTVAETYNLISSLQTNLQENSSPHFDDGLFTNHYVPLFIGISQEGDGIPYDQIISGLTPLPNPMAIGATWNPDMSQKAGSVLGKELSTLGFNLYLGPSLDVLDVLYSESGEDLGTRTFGSDPYWVGKMGQAYIQGIHTGSDNRIAVIAKHFPGRGGSDRPPEEEIATVRKSLEQLKQIELAPFFEVTGKAPDSLSSTDGLLVSHIRYQGFQGNIRATTRPMSFDQAALEQIMMLEQFASWRENGGLIVSDDLGSLAVRKFYDPTDLSFDARQVARNAFLAGNDLLFMDDFLSSEDEDVYTTILRTLESFIQKYYDDPAFAQKVDQSVERLLTAKYRIYPEFTLENVIPPDEELEDIGKSQQITFEIAQNAVTLISPEASELGTLLPRAPAIRERIIFISDTINARQCSTCEAESIISADTMQNAVLRLYGPQAGGQVISARMSSYSFEELLSLIEEPNEDSALKDDLLLADWVVFSLLDFDSNRPASSALKNFLSSQPNLLHDKKVVAFAFNVPYYLDATDISNLTAYYGLYSKEDAFIDAAARILFDELTPTGALPVSVPSVGYSLIQITSPDPDQIIHIYVDKNALPDQEENATDATTSPEAEPAFTVGDNLPLQTSIIVDQNQNPVPDGTVVRFSFTTTTGSEISSVHQIETTTIDGIASANFRIQAPGLLEIRSSSEPATRSDLLQLNVAEGKEAFVTAIVPLPTNQPTPTPEPTDPPPPTITPSYTPIPLSTPSPLPIPTAGDWFLSMILIWTSAGMILWLNIQVKSLRWAIRWGLLSATGGLLGYLYLTIGLPGSTALVSSAGRAAIPIMTIGGLLLGWSVGWLWYNKKDSK